MTLARVDDNIDPENPPKELVNCFDEMYHDFGTAKIWTTYDDTEKVLSQLQNQNMKIGILTNSDERVYSILKSLKLDSYFQFILPSSTTKFMKPNIEIFRHMSKKWKVDLSSHIHTGDDWKADIQGALKAGCLKAIYIDRRKSNVQNETPRVTIVSDLTQILV